MRLRVLGTTCGGALPQWNCGGANSVNARRGDPAVPARLHASLAISAGDARWSLVNATPDLREQLARFPGLHPKPGTRSVPLDTIVLTDASLAHTLGLLSLTDSLSYRVITTPWIRDALLEHNAMFQLLAPAFGTVKIDEPFFLDRGEQLEAKLFPIPGKAPAWTQPIASASAESTLGMRVVDKRSGKRVVYAPYLQRLDSATLAELAEADVRVVDGTFFSAGELRTLRPGAPDAHALGHTPVGGADGSLRLLGGMRGRTLYTHLNCTNPMLDARSPEAAHVRAGGAEIASDGMELAL
ncbi:MAG: pyrroloquinoline quinone biosynthesis protein PqqB [Deltaproteobacteria bacterium]|nr:pyrroloquinoline quinone biosynthesis protein PqqB [Deltaproteobacteria bacterium]